MCTLKVAFGGAPRPSPSRTRPAARPLEGAHEVLAPRPPGVQLLGRGRRQRSARPGPVHSLDVGSSATQAAASSGVGGGAAGGPSGERRRPGARPAYGFGAKWPGRRRARGLAGWRPGGSERRSVRDQRGGYRPSSRECGADAAAAGARGPPAAAGHRRVRAGDVGRGRCWRRGRTGSATAGTPSTARSSSCRSASRRGATPATAWCAGRRGPSRSARGLGVVGVRLMSQPGYPWTLDLHVLLRPVRRGADRHGHGDEPERVAGAVRTGGAPVPHGRQRAGRRVGADAARAMTRLLIDEQMMPTGREYVADTDLDFRMARPIRSTRSTPPSPMSPDGVGRGRGRPARSRRRRGVAALDGREAPLTCRCSPGTSCRSTPGSPWRWSR